MEPLYSSAPWGGTSQPLLREYLRDLSDALSRCDVFSVFNTSELSQVGRDRLKVWNVIGKSTDEIYLNMLRLGGCVVAQELYLRTKPGENGGLESSTKHLFSLPRAHPQSIWGPSGHPNSGLSESEGAEGRKMREGVWKKVLRLDENGTYSLDPRRYQTSLGARTGI